MTSAAEALREQVSPPSPSPTGPGSVRRFILPALFVAALFATLFLRQPEPTSSGGAGEAVRTITVAGGTMGTVYQVKVVTSDMGSDIETRIASGINRTLAMVNEAMSTYMPESELSKFNQRQSTEPVEISSPLAVVIERAQAISDATSGAFDVTVGPLVNAWGFGPDGRQNPPDETRLEALRGQVGYGMLKLNGRQLTKKRPDLYVDLSAIAKGYGVDQIALMLEGMGLNRYLVDIGGEVRGRGLNEGGRAWRVGVEKPLENARAVREVIALKAGSMATSGDYRNFYEVDGVRISHTVDARTGRPIRHRLAAVTVVAKECMDADAWATALNVLGADEGFKIAQDNKLAALFVIRGTDGRFTEKVTPQFVEARERSRIEPQK